MVDARNQNPAFPAYYNLTIYPAGSIFLALHPNPFYNFYMHQAFHLYRLQQIDIQIDQAESVIAEVDHLIASDETIRSAKNTTEAARTQLHLAQQRLKQAEFAVHEQQAKIALSEASLYSGRLHNPKELQDLQKEITSLKKHLAVLEDNQLEAMMSLEECEAHDSSAQQQLNTAESAFAEKSAGLLGKKEQNLHQLERLRVERAAALTLPSAEAIQTYEMLRKRKSGVAVTTAKNGACTVCGGTIRPSEVQNARATQGFVYCSNCGRILYAG